MVSHFTASFSSFQRRKPFGTWHKILSWDETTKTSIKLCMDGVCVKRVKIWPPLPVLWQTGNGPITQAEKNSVLPTHSCQKVAKFVTKAKCGNIIFLLLRLYVKSIFRNSRNAKSAIFTFLEALNFAYWYISALKKVKKS